KEGKNQKTCRKDSFYLFFLLKEAPTFRGLLLTFFLLFAFPFRNGMGNISPGARLSSKISLSSRKKSGVTNYSTDVRSAHLVLVRGSANTFMISCATHCIFLGRLA
ncbi:unnamed protein product, partial [Amoebophrya sp. A120]